MDILVETKKKWAHFNWVGVNEAYDTLINMLDIAMKAQEGQKKLMLQKIKRMMMNKEKGPGKIRGSLYLITSYIQSMPKRSLK